MSNSPYFEDDIAFADRLLQMRHTMVTTRTDDYILKASLERAAVAVLALVEAKAIAQKNLMTPNDSSPKVAAYDPAPNAE